jgi:hypothetical protein
MLMPWLPKKLQNVMAITEVLASFYQSLQKQKGHFHDTRNSGFGPRRRHGTDNGLCVWPSPAAFDLKQMGTSFPDVIDYFAMGVLVFIALLAVARLFPPPDRAQ